MESRAFIIEVSKIIREIEDHELAVSCGVGAGAEDGPNLQKRVSQLFAGLQNPTLPSAYKLRNKALEVGMFVDPKVQHRLAQFEYLN